MTLLIVRETDFFFFLEFTPSSVKSLGREENLWTFREKYLLWFVMNLLDPFISMLGNRNSVIYDIAQLQIRIVNMSS